MPLWCANLLPLLNSSAVASPRKGPCYVILRRGAPHMKNVRVFQKTFRGRIGALDESRRRPQLWHETISHYVVSVSSLKNTENPAFELLTPNFTIARTIR